MGPITSKDQLAFLTIITQYSKLKSSVPSFSHVWIFGTPLTAPHQVSLAITNTRSLLKLMSIELVMPSNHLILCHPLLLPPSILPNIRVFSNRSVLRIRWPEYWSFSFSPSNEYSRLISFRIDWFDLLAVQGTLKSCLQHHSSKASILQCLAFFIVQLSHPYITTGKTIALTSWTFVGKVMSLLLNMLSRLVITFLPRSNHVLISCQDNLQQMRMFCQCTANSRSILTGSTGWKLSLRRDIWPKTCVKERGRSRYVFRKRYLLGRD